MDGQGTAAKVGISAALLVLSFLVAIQLPSTALTGKATSTAAVSSGGRLLVSVTLDNGSLFRAPLPKVQVAIAQFLFHGLRVVLATNQTGEVEFPLPAGRYSVSVSNDKFALSTTVPVNPGQVTHLQVAVNRTANYASFVAADDSTSQGTIEPWNTVTVQVSPYSFLRFSPFFLLGGQFSAVPVGQQNPPTLGRFGAVVYMQPMNVYEVPPAYETRGGAEVPATVVSRVMNSGFAWLTLRLTEPLQLAGPVYLLVVRYQASSTVTFQ